MPQFEISDWQAERFWLNLVSCLSAVGMVDANANGVVEAQEVAMYYGMVDRPCVKPALNVMGVKFGGGEPC